MQDALERSGLAPERLCLEITETALMRNPEVASATLERLDALGVELAIDDFGTGYSSLAYLKRFPVDVLKIDRTFVMGLPADAEDTAIVRSVIDLAGALGMTVTAEGIEETEQATALDGARLQPDAGLPVLPADAGDRAERRCSSGSAATVAAALSEPDQRSV